MYQNVEIKLQRDEIIINLNPNSDFKQIIDELNEKLPDLRNLYKDADIPIFVTGKVLKNIEMNEIRELINSEIPVKIRFDSPKVLGLHGIKRAYNQEIIESNTIYFKGSLRSGQKLENEGSIVIIGDLNSGAEAIAGENIVVLGKLCGLAHAGAKGNRKAIIAAENIDTPQIRISNIIKEMKKTDENEETYTFAHVNGNKIELE